MNTSLLARFARQTALAASKRSPAVTATLLRGLSIQSNHHETEVAPPEDYYDGHLMADHLEYLEDMIEKTDMLKASMEELKLTKLAAVERASSGVKWIEAAEIDRLFDQTARQKEEITAGLAELKAKMAEARKTYAVDAPDGYPDGYFKEEMAEINHIIDDAAVLEDKDKINYQHKMDEKIRKERARDPEHDG